MDSELDRVLIAIGRKMQSVLRRHLPPDLTLTQAWVLGLLDERSQIPLSEVAEHLDLSLSAASNVVDQLIHTDWVVRERDLNDRRVVTVSMTEAGRQMVEEAKNRRREIVDAILSHLSADDTQQLHDILQKLEHVLSTPLFS